MNLKEKKALLTGADCCIGKDCALALARNGAILVVNDRPECKKIDLTVSEIRVDGGVCLGSELS
jgi:NAD(P)-dependent dehydrogenase (short-subunit alcohol dehydrogenase family)